MKLSKKDIAKFQAKEAKVREGRVANNLDQAWEQLKQKLEQPETLAVLQRMKDK